VSRYFAPLALVVIGLALYASCFTHPFVWDDEEQILANNSITSLSNIPEFFLGSTFNSGGSANLTGLYYKPILTTSYALLYSFFGTNPFGYHVFQVLLHISNALLLFYFLRNFFQDRGRCFLITLIFLIHPIQVESVVYIAGLQEPLFMFFGLLTLNLFSFANGKFLFLAGPLLLLSLLSKETGLIFLVLVPLYAYLFAHKGQIFSLFSSLGALIIYLFLRFGLAQLPIAEHNLTPINRLSLLERLPTIPKIITHYFGHFFVPYNLSISEHWVVSSFNWSDFFLPLIICLALAYATFLLILWQEKHKIRNLYFLAWFVLGLGLHLHFIPLDFTVSDRWFYLPIIGLTAFLVSFLPAQKIFGFKDRYLILYLYLVFLLISSLTRIEKWQSGLTLYQNDIRLSPNSFDLTNNLGVELLRHGQIDEAQQYFLRSTQLAPYWWINFNNLGVTLENAGNASAAAEAYQIAIDNGNYYLAYENYARLLINNNQLSEAAKFLTTALKQFPNNVTLQEFAQYVQQIE